jgi:hypothetical protein
VPDDDTPVIDFPLKCDISRDISYFEKGDEISECRLISASPINAMDVAASINLDSQATPVALDMSFEIPMSEASPKLGSTMESRLTIPSRHPIQLRHFDQSPEKVLNSSDMSYTDRFDTNLLQSIMDSKETLSFGNYDEDKSVIPTPLLDLNISDVARSPKKRGN